jgi:hypothetical protein
LRFDARWPWQGISRYHGTVTRAKRKNPNGSGTDARKRSDGRYETRATLNTPTDRRRVSFYGETAEEANNAKFQALADQAKGILFSDPGRLTVGEYISRWLTDTARFQVSEVTYQRYERTCRYHLVPFFGRLRLRELTAAHVRAFKARKIEEGLNPNTVGVMQGPSQWRSTRRWTTASSRPTRPSRPLRADKRP